MRSASEETIDSAAEDASCSEVAKVLHRSQGTKEESNECESDRDIESEIQRRLLLHCLADLFSGAKVIGEDVLEGIGRLDHEERS